jgi:hypothetical protein
MALLKRKSKPGKAAKERKPAKPEKKLKKEKAKKETKPRAPRGPVVRVPSDVYTALVVVATVFVMTGTGFLAYRSQQLFETYLPMAAAG